MPPYKQMISLFGLPYLWLVLVALEEYEALWLCFFFLVPLLDVMFYVETPPTTHWKYPIHRLLVWVWFPLVCCLSYTAPVSWKSMVSVGVLHNISLCLADELAVSGSVYDRWLEDLICDFMGFFRMDSLVCSLARFGVFLLLTLDTQRLFWHLGAILVGTMLYEYVNRVECAIYPNTTKLAQYGLGHYAMFRCQEAALLPTSHMWSFAFWAWQEEE